MSRRDGSIRVMGGSGYKLSIVIISVLAVALAIFMLVVLPVLEQEPQEERRIISIEYPQGEIGVGDNLSLIYVEVSYSDGEKVSVPLSDMICLGLDLSQPGRQNVSLSYGGFEQVLPIQVKSVDCQINYQASTGGVIEGDTSQSIPIGQSGSKVIARPEVGYIFVNWSDGNPEAERTDIKVTADATYIANFEKAKYVVIFHYPDDTVAKEQLVPYNERPTQVPPPSDPKMRVYGYRFVSWDKPFDHVTQNMEIYPIFEKYATDISLEITKNEKGEVLGTTDLPSVGYYPKNQQAILKASPLQARSFAGWQIKRFDGTWINITVEDIDSMNGFRNIAIGTETNNINFEASRVGDTNEFHLTFTPNDNTNLIEIKADFVYDVSTITFINSMSPNQGNIEKTVNLEIGVPIGPHLTDPVGVGFGYNFIGWYRAYASGELVDVPVQPEDTFTMPTTLVARWQKIYYAVNFLTGEGNLPPKTVYVLYQNSLASAVEEPVYINPVPTKAIPDQIPYREHYRFVGWYIVGEGNILTDIVIDEDFKVYEDINVRPKFVPLEHELTINLNGPGMAQRRNITDGGSYEEMPAGINIVQETKRYVYRFIADEGYQIKSIDNNGNVTNYSENAEWAEAEIFYPTQNQYITVEIVPKTYQITVQNGLLDDAGSIRYTIKSGDTVEEIVSASSVITFSIEHNTTKNVEITALPTHFISAIQINGIEVVDIPLGANDYTLILTPENILDDTIVVIQYSPFAFEVDLVYASEITINEMEYDEQEDAYYSVPKSATYEFGMNPLFKFSALQGYYLRALVINGKAMDLYSPDIGFEIFSIKVNYAPLENGHFDLTDERVTEFILKIENINSDYTIEPLYAEIYYNINIDFTGRGEIESEFEKVLYGESIQIQAYTDGGYYVKSYAINGEEFVCSEMLESQIIDIEDITQDIFVTIEFSIATYIIAFDGSTGGGWNASVRYESQEKRPLNTSYVVEHNSSNRFTVYANEGYYISYIAINGNEVVIPYKAVEQFLQIDNVTGYKHVVIKCARMTYEVVASVNNTEYGSITEQVEVKHGEDAVLYITYNPGYTLSSISEGTLSESNTVLTISNVVEDKYIFVELEPVPSDFYTITVQTDGNGSAEHPSVARFGEEVFILITAQPDYVIDQILDGEDEIILIGVFRSYALNIQVTQNTVISVSFKEYEMTASNPINIYQDEGGRVNGMEGDFSIDTYQDVWETILIEANQNYYVHAVNGMEYLERPQKAAYVLDGGETEIIVEYRLVEYSLNLQPVENGSVQIVVRSSPEQGFIPSNTATNSDYVRIYVAPDTGYELKEIRINGVIAASDLGGADYFDISSIEKDQNISVVFRPQRFQITTETTSGRGTISAPDSYFEYGKGMTINIIPDVGYYIEAVSLNGEWLEGAELQSVISSQRLNIPNGSALTKQNILVWVNFRQINHDITIEIIGDGMIDKPTFDQIPYGETYLINITASEYNYIEALEIDGIKIAVDNTNLQSYTFDNTTQRYTAGIYRLLVTSDMHIKIIFRINSYTVKILPSVNGNTTVNLYEKSDMPLGHGEIVELNIDRIEHGGFIQIAMQADNGYNIARLFINNVEIFGFKNDNVNPNNNRLINYIYTGHDDKGVTGNILIRVDYQVNSYKFEYQTINESPNFKDFDIHSNSYGDITVLGSYQRNGNVYSGIPHGENFRISINPVREKGYVISGVTIIYNDPSKEDQSLVYIRPQVGGPGATILRTGAMVFFSDLMGEYADAMVADVQLIQIRFTKEILEYDHEVVTAPHTGTIVTRFYHPNDSSRAYTFGSEEPTSLILVDGKFEYGLAFTVTAAPATGYSRTAFYYVVNGSIIDRTNSVRGNVYNSSIQSNILVKVEYEVNRHDIIFEYRVYNENDNIISNPGEEYGTIVLIAGEDIVYPINNKIIYYDCAYDTDLTFMLIPAYETRGYYIQAFIVGVENIFIEDKNSSFNYYRKMGNNDLNATVNFKINTYTISYELEGHDGRNSISSLTLGSIPWGRNVTLRINTDVGYDLIYLEVYQNEEWHDRLEDIIYGVPQIGGPPIDVLYVNSIKNDIIVKSGYQRREYDIVVTVNDLGLGAIRTDIVGDFYPNYTDIAQAYSQISEQTEGWIYDPILHDYIWGPIELTWDIVTMKAKHYDELVFYLMPNNGYKVDNHLDMEVRLFTYEDGERVPVLDQDLQPIKYLCNTYGSDPAYPDYRAFSLSTELYLTNNIEFEVNFVLKEYDVTYEKSPSSLEGVNLSVLTVQVFRNEEWQEVVNMSRLNHFDQLRIYLEPVYGLSLDQMIINDRSVSYTDYERIDYHYRYYFELEINDELLNGQNFLHINARLERNSYFVEVEIYDNKSGETTYGKIAPTVQINVVDIITHNNTLIITPNLSEGYSIVMVVINGVDYSNQIDNMNSAFSFLASGSLVDGLDVEDPLNCTLHIYIETAINLHISDIRAFVYEQGVDDFSDIAGETTVTYSPADAMAIVDGVVKYEYFTAVTVTAVARSTAGKNYRFAYYQERVDSVWVTVRDGERGIRLSGEDHSVLEYTIREIDNVKADRYFRAVYYRVLTVTVEVFNDYKYISGYYTSGNMRYLPYLTVEASIGTTILQDQNLENYPIYQQASQTGEIPYVKRYIYYVDSGSYLILKAIDNKQDTNESALAFYDRSDSQSFSVINNISTTGIRILDDRDIYLAARNQTMLSYSIATIANERGANGGSLSWLIHTYDNQTRNGSTNRGSMTDAKVLDVVTVTVNPANHYNFTGLYIKNVDQQATRESGELKFMPEGSVGEWTLISESTDYITKRKEGNLDVFDIFVTGNMVMKFEFYRTFRITYSADYQGIGDGLGDVIKDEGASTPPFDTEIVGGKLYEKYEYNAQIRLRAPETNEDYQFIGWQVNGDNIYKDLEFIYPGQAVFNRWFRLYQNSDERGVFDGLDLRIGGEDVYDIEIVALYQPIFKIGIINELFFYNDDDRHWNSWIATNELSASFYEYFSEAQVNAGESEGNPFALASFQAYKNIFINQEPQSVLDVYGQRIPERAIAPEYDNEYPEWSLIRRTVSNPSDSYWADKKIYTATRYYKLLMQQLLNPLELYNIWSDNILYLDVNLYDDMTLIEWQYYNWDTGQYEEIPFTSNNGINNPKVPRYHINLKECDFIDHTKPFIIRPLFQKRVTLNLMKKAFFYDINDHSGIGNSAQQPQILNSPNTDTNATFNYYDKVSVIPRPGEGYRFLGWYVDEFDDIKDESLREYVLPGETTIAWEVHLIFDFDDIRQDVRTLYGRYMKQWEMIIESRNLATGDRLKTSAPKLILIEDSLPEDPDCYEKKVVSDFYIEIIIDAGYTFSVQLDKNPVGDDEGTTEGFNSIYDKEYLRTGLNDANDSEQDLPNNYTQFNLYSFSKRKISFVYETLGVIVFENLMPYSSIRLPNAMGTAVNRSFPSEFPQTPIRIPEGYNTSERGKAIFDKVPIRNTNYLGHTYQDTYNFVPYGFTDDYSIPVLNSKIIPTGYPENYVVDYGHFNSQSVAGKFRKKITLDYRNYIMFGVSNPNTPPGTMNNPYLIGGSGKSISKVREEFRNIDEFFKHNGSSVKDIVFRLESDVHLNRIDSAGQDPQNAWSWIPICYQNGKGFNGTLLGNGKRLLSLYVNGESSYFPPTVDNVPQGEYRFTDYRYAENGYGVFAHIENGVIDNLVLGTAVIRLNQIIREDGMGSYDTIQRNVGYLAAKVSGYYTEIKNIRIDTASTGSGYMGYNIYITSSSAIGVAVIAGTIACNADTSRVINSKLNNIELRGSIYIGGRESIGGVAGYLREINATNIRVTGSNTLRLEAFSQKVGGLIGSIDDANVYESYIDTRIEIGNDSCASSGGLIGQSSGANYGCEIVDCYLVGNANTYIQTSRMGNGGDGPKQSTESGLAGGIVAKNLFGSSIEGCYIRGNIKLMGYYTGGLAAYNTGILKNCVLNLSANPFNLVVEAPEATSNGSYGILVGINAYDEWANGLIIDCGILGTGRGITPSQAPNYSATNRIMFVYQKNYSLATPSTDQSLDDINTTVAFGYTNIGGITGLNEGRVFNSFLKNTKIVAVKNSPGDYIVSMGGVAGFNNVGAVSQGRGISSSFAEGNALILSNIMYANAVPNSSDPEDSNNKAARIGIGGVAGGTRSMQAHQTDDMDFSIRYCYAIDNYFGMRSSAYGTGFEEKSILKIGIDLIKIQVPINNYNYLNAYVGLIVGGPRPEMSRCYYCWGGTNSSFVSINDYYKSTGENYSAGGTPLRDGPSPTLIGSQYQDPSGIYGEDRWENADNENYRGRTVLMDLSISPLPYGAGSSNFSNSPASYGGFIGGTVVQNNRQYWTDSRVFKTDQNGNLLWVNQPYEWDSDGYIGEVPYEELELLLVPYQTKYSYSRSLS